MTIVEQSGNFMATNLRISSKDFLFAFNVFNVSSKFQYFWGKELDLSNDFSKIPINENYTVKLYYENPETKTVEKEYYLDTEYCEIGKNINKNIIEKYNFTEYQNYLCISDKSNAEIIINNTYNTYIVVIVNKNITNSNGINIELESLDNSSITTTTNYLQFEMYSPNDIISNKNETTPVNYRKNYYYYELVSPGTLKTIEIITKYIDYSSDNGHIFKQIQNFSGFFVESIQTKHRV